MNNKKGLILTIIALLTLTIFVVGATYAYFSAQGGASTSANINVTTSTTDLLTFNVGSDINIYADQTTFGQNKTSLYGTTTATATLTANNSTNDTTMNYYVYLNITSNTFNYTQNENTPELILTITGPDGELTSLDGYTYKTVTDNKGTSISGFDVTTANGLITIANNEPITAGTQSTVAKATNSEEWTITLTFVNYNADQTANAGSGLTAKVIIQKDEIVLAYHESCNSSLLACKVAKNYTGIQGENNIYYHDLSLTNGAGDNSYRYAGPSSSVNNYVCFGSDDDTCPTDNLYRIIGVIDGKVKLIKSTSLGNMKWDSNGSNTWSTSSLNTYLNGTYLNTFSEDWQEKIATTTWKVGGISSSGVTPATMYTNEMNSTSSGTDGLTEYSSKVALMYAHDYGFAASPTAWTITLNNYNGNDSAGTSITTNDWLYLGSYEWLISRTSSQSSYSSLVFSSGYVIYNNFSVTFSYAVRPVLFLESTATYLDGTGTSDNPYRL